MSDKELAGIARALAEALIRRAYERDPESSKQVLFSHTELCAAYRAELREAGRHDETGHPTGDGST